MEMGETYAEQHQWATSNFLNDENRDKCCHQILRAVASSQQFWKVSFSKTNLAVQ